MTQCPTLPGPYVDDGFGVLLEHCGGWYHANPSAEVPAWMIRSNYQEASRFLGLMEEAPLSGWQLDLGSEYSNERARHASVISHL